MRIFQVFVDLSRSTAREDEATRVVSIWWSSDGTARIMILGTLSTEQLFSRESVRQPGLPHDARNLGTNAPKLK
jgi:hypothetical protein